jgi:hypothetical protein
VSYTQQMKAINEFGGDDGGVEHPGVECIMLHGCAHKENAHRCRTLGMCGCALVYDLAHQRGGYQVIVRDNVIAQALVDADMVHVEDAGIVAVGPTDAQRYRTSILRPNLHCGIPRPNSTIDLQAVPHGTPWEKR